MNPRLNMPTSDLAVDIRKVLGCTGEYRIGFTRQCLSDEINNDFLKSVPGGEVRLSLTCKSNTVLDVQVAVDADSQSAEGICHVYTSGDDLLGLMENGKLSLELAITNKKG